MIAGVTPAALSEYTSLCPSYPVTPHTLAFMVTVLEENRHNLETGDRVTLSEIVGSGIYSALNGQEFDVAVKNCDPYNFFIVAVSNETRSTAGIYERGGYANQIKKPVAISFQPLRESVLDPKEIICDFMKFERVAPMHVAFMALKRCAIG